MNCLDFQRQCLADPVRIDQELLKHVRTCGRCSEFFHEARSLDKKLAAVIRFDTPENLVSNILRQQPSHEHGKRNFSHYFALAATLFIAVAIGLVISWNYQDPDLDALVMAYVESAPAHRSPAASIDHGVMDGVLQPLGMALSRDFGPVLAARPCLIRGNDAAHLVVPGDKGRVDLLYMPYEEIAKRTEVNRKDSRLILIPCPKGVLAILGREDEQLAAIESRFHAASVWL